MYISRLSLINYRNFANAKLIFKKGINTIIGENGAGKTNVFRAIRLLLDDNMLRSAYRLDINDFNRNLGDWRCHWIIISLEFDELSQDEAIQSLFLHSTGNVSKGGVKKATYNLIFRPRFEIRHKLSELKKGDVDGLKAIRETVHIDDYETIFTGKSEADFNDVGVYKAIVGDFENVEFSKVVDHNAIGIKAPQQLSISKEVSLTFIKALRDVVSDFQDSRSNPLRALLKRRSENIDSVEYEPITTMVKGLNASIESLSDVQAVRTDIKDTIKGAVGETYAPTSLSIKSDLSDDADKVLQSLKLFIGEADEGYEGGIHELSLGGANLIYLTLKLIEFKYQQSEHTFANFLLIEEPEAHIHTHIQKSLFTKLEYADTQIIYSTHSTHISEVCNVQSMNILARDRNVCDAFHPSIGLSSQQAVNIQRYLDAVRSNLLFAKGIILVEGDAEEILVPILVKNVIGVSLDELGISVINVRSTGFENVAALFHDDRIRRRCSIVTDLDASIIDITPDANDTEADKKFKERCKGSEKAGIARKARLDKFADGNQWLGVFYADHTFEVDFVKAGNAHEVQQLTTEVYKDKETIDLTNDELESGDVSVYGKRVLTMANYEGKGWFAILLGNHIKPHTFVPKYIIDAISFVNPTISNDLWLDIINHQWKYLQSNYKKTDFGSIEEELLKFKKGHLTISELKNTFVGEFPGSPIEGIMAGMVCSA